MNVKVRDPAVLTREHVQADRPPISRDVEATLVSRLRLGEEEAFRQLVTDQHGRLIRIAMRYVASRDVAEEVVQDTWMAVLTSINRFEGRSSLRAWICGILIHKAKDRGMRDQRSRPFSSFNLDGDTHGDAIGQARSSWCGDFPRHQSFARQLWDDQTPEKLLLSKQAVDCMQRAIADLPHTLKDVLILRDADGMETHEVCTRLNVTEANLYVRLHRARQRVRMAITTTLG